jgi:DNA-binding MarR family transcriptional regulator
MSSSRRFPQFKKEFALKDIKTYHVGSLESSAHRSIRAFKDQCLKKYELTAMQWYIIGTIQDAGEHGMRITDLSNQLGTTLGFMTNSVNLLVSKNILERISHVSDSRSKIVVVRSSYKKTFNDIEKELRTLLRNTIYKDLSPQELKSYIKTLHTLANISE